MASMAVTIKIQTGISAPETKKKKSKASQENGGPLSAGKKEPTNPKIMAEIDRITSRISIIIA